jgi:hypothetical protein
MSNISVADVKMAEVIRLSESLARSILFDRILGRHVAKERTSLLMRVAIVLHENEISWPASLKEVISWQVDLSETDTRASFSKEAENCVHGAVKQVEQTAVLSGQLNGHIDVCNMQIIAGWAQDVLRPDIPVNLEIVCGGKVIGTVTANFFREDLKLAGIGDGNHAFVFHFLEGSIDRFDAVSIRKTSGNIID